jgi:hypothetical protein
MNSTYSAMRLAWETLPEGFRGLAKGVLATAVVFAAAVWANFLRDLLA